MELKLRGRQRKGVKNNCFNRTFMELKLLIMLLMMCLTLVLIVPLWN